MPSVTGPPFPPLPHVQDPARPVIDDPVWTYPSRCAGGGGIALLRAWPTDRGGHLAILTDSGVGVSITNAAEDIAPKLAKLLPGPLVVMEHYPRTGPDCQEHMDQVVVVNGVPHWRPVWPIPPVNPRFAENDAWMRGPGSIVLTARK